MEDPAASVLRHFRWVEGHGDIWRVFADADALEAVIDGLVAPWRAAGVTHVVGIESRGFLLGAACAVQLGAGFVAVRKGGTSLLPGPKHTVTAEEDYRGQRHRLRMQAVLTQGDRVLLVDDWAERGSQALGAVQLCERSDAEFLGLSVIVDMLASDVRASFPRVTSLVSGRALGPSSGS